MDVDTGTEVAETPVEVVEEQPEAPVKKDAAPLKEEVKETVRKLKLKINGAEKEYDEKSVIAMAQRALAADKKFQEAANERKRIEQIIASGKNDPDKLIKELTGKDPMEVYKERIAREINRLSMDPKDLELEEYKAKIAEFEKREQERLENEKKQSIDKATEFYTKKYDKEIPAELQKVGLPVNEDTVRYTAEVMLANIQEGLELPYEVVMDIVKDKYVNSFKGFMSKSDKEKLIDLLGEDTVDELIAAKTKRANKNAKKAPTMALPQEAQDEPKVSKSMTRDELDEYIKNWAKNQ